MPAMPLTFLDAAAFGRVPVNRRAGSGGRTILGNLRL